MTVDELIKILENLNPDQEILGDFPISKVTEEEYEGKKYYCIGGDC